MNKLDFFLAAMAGDTHRRRAWVFSAFALINEGPDDWEKDPYPYRIVQRPTGHFYVNPEKTHELVPLEGSKAGEAPFLLKDRIQLKKGQIPNLTKDVDTTYGNLLFNYVAVIYPFGNKIPYREGRISAKDMEKLIVESLQDTPKDDSERKQDVIYVDEYLKFCDAMFYLAGFTQLCVPALTPKAMTAPTGIKEFRQKLLDENKDRLHDPAVIAKIDAALVKYDADYLKGDDSEGFLINSKSRETVRRKLYLMHGAETGLGEGVNVDLIQNSLSEGWDIKKFPSMNDSLRAGSFNRGAQTMLGGEAVKWLLRASSNMIVTVDDCGSRLGNVVVLTEDNRKKYTGFSVVTPAGHEHLDKETIQKYIGKEVMIRSPMYCKLEKTDFCKCCVGDRLAVNPTALSSAVADYGSVFLDIYMSAAHAKNLILAKMNYKTAIQ